MYMAYWSNPPVADCIFARLTVNAHLRHPQYPKNFMAFIMSPRLIR
jgi:hypothetical protein